MASTSNARMQLLTPSDLRLDSRLPLELRSLSFEILPSPPTVPSTSYALSAPSNPDGYALVSHGLTTVSSSVLGPREPSRSGPFSGSGGGAGAGAGGSAAGTASGPTHGNGARSGDKARVNVEVGVAAWTERLGRKARTEEHPSGIRANAKDRSVHWNRASSSMSLQCGTTAQPGQELTRTPIPISSRRTVELAASLKATFEPVLLLHLYPRSSIDIYIQVLEVDGALLQAAINATTLALIAAGLPLTDYICSLSLASYPSISPLAPPQIPPFELTSPPVHHSNDPKRSRGSGSTTLLDLTQAEEQALPNLTVAVLPRSGKVTLVGLESRLGVGRFEEMLRWGVEGAKVVQGAMEEAVSTWAANLAKPSRSLKHLFPGMNKGSAEGEDEMSE
ncbi:BZ3500_MvSof-1268-A1-R1_Chr12-2g03710 [Microbotryum saponariae]|uniref:BZ3500_MvSof-1268-A1-R1_Chr12-2g03710 protein n=1 Tax=Microbotryum saponariae TaxID=289078 RepID=A0A2X0KRD5_9BASI|nr:BZ3500_MvSof-1268-A1-R1_Chr12-2g03710 [Microbotryum saponariae]SDA05298.1 BZ3501_MvSof-1269-A2-R1_Chr12-1g03282 [Microbotryum saponariae]